MQPTVYEMHFDMGTQPCFLPSMSPSFVPFAPCPVLADPDHRCILYLASFFLLRSGKTEEKDPEKDAESKGNGSVAVWLASVVGLFLLLSFRFVYCFIS